MKKIISVSGHTGQSVGVICDILRENRFYPHQWHKKSPEQNRKPKKQDLINDLLLLIAYPYDQ